MLNRPDPTKVATVAQRLTYARLCVPMTREAAAKRTRIPFCTLQDYERGKRAVPLQRLGWLAKLYKVRPSWLSMGEGETPTPPPPPRRMTELERIMRCL
jgi:transcriptional regulator with XRE-family HTH domain